MIICLLQQEKWLMAGSTINKVKQNTRRKVTEITPQKVMELIRIIICPNQLGKLRIFSTQTNRIFQMQNILSTIVLTVETSRKLNEKYLGILSISLTTT